MSQNEKTYKDKSDLLFKVFIPREYPEIKYLPVGHQLKFPENKLMSMEDAQKTFGQIVVVEEELDGKLVEFRTDRFFIYAKDMEYTYSIFYRVPARFAIIDIFDYRRMMFLCRDHKESVFEYIKKGEIKIEKYSPEDFFLVPKICVGGLLLEHMEHIPKLVRLSAYGYEKDTDKRVLMKGVVVKPNRELFLVEFKYCAGKYIREEFSDEAKVEHLDLKPKGKNIIDPDVNIPADYCADITEFEKEYKRKKSEATKNDK
jgi:hypothetical protein